MRVSFLANRVIVVVVIFGNALFNKTDQKCFVNVRGNPNNKCVIRNHKKIENVISTNLLLHVSRPNIVSCTALYFM